MEEIAFGTCVIIAILAFFAGFHDGVTKASE